MKMKIIFSILFIFLTQNIVYSDNYSKQAEIEVKRNEYLVQMIQNDKTVPYKLMMLEDYLGFYNRVSEYNTVFQDLLNFQNKYKEQQNSDNYKYTVKALDLYKGIIEYIFLDEKKKASNLQLEKINIPNEKINKLDKEIVVSIITLNIILTNIQNKEVK